MRYRLSPLAEEDLRELWNYVAQDSSEERADKLIDAIFDRFDMLATHPRVGRRRPEFGDAVRSDARLGGFWSIRMPDRSRRRELGE